MECPKDSRAHDDCIKAHSRYKRSQLTKRVKINGLVFPKHRPRPACKCEVISPNRGWLKKYSPKHKSQPYANINEARQVRPKGDQSPVPATESGVNRLGHYVYRKDERGFIDVETNAPTTDIERARERDARTKRPYVSEEFPIATETMLYGRNPDGSLVERGLIRADKVKINYGQWLNKSVAADGNIQGFVYVFATCILKPPEITLTVEEQLKNFCSPKPRAQTEPFEPSHYPASGWVDINKLTEFRDVVEKMREEPGIAPPYPYKNNYRPCTIMGGVISPPMKVNPCVSASKSEAANDYLTRPGGFVNLLSALPGMGGVTKDTFKIGTTFHLLDKDKIPRPVEIPLYRPCDAQVRRFMKFVYGFVGDSDPKKKKERKYGWIAADALQCSP